MAFRKAAEAVATYRHHLAERFWAKVSEGPGCWEWTGSRHAWGYGWLGVGLKTVSAHRISWEIHHGPIPKGLWVLHGCDNPPCVRPSHLRLGTPKDNAKDCRDRGRLTQAHRTHCRRGHPYSGDNLYLGVNRLGGPARVCRTCMRIHTKNYHQRVKERKVAHGA